MTKPLSAEQADLVEALDHVIEPLKHQPDQYAEAGVYGWDGAGLREKWRLRRLSALTNLRNAITTGQHQVIDTAESVAVKRMSVDEAREALYKAAPPGICVMIGSTVIWEVPDYEAARIETVWLAALRLVGAVVDEKEEGDGTHPNQTGAWS